MSNLKEFLELVANKTVDGKINWKFCDNDCYYYYDVPLCNVRIKCNYISIAIYRIVDKYEDRFIFIDDKWFVQDFYAKIIASVNNEPKLLNNLYNVVSVL